ncbi:MAG: methionine--tRNA ligase, partial [Acidobacteria bacterium]|nr:methionine--tRNA ligase [Acidobacteriota bacterium]
MQSRTSPILITAALPYANGDIHLGHMVEYLQTDIYTRFLRGTEHDVVFLCADDCHGTPIQIKARELKITPELLIGRFRQRHERDFRDFGVQFDLYHSTHSDECKQQVYEIFERLNVAGYIRQDSVEQYFCDVDGIYLPDRFLRARCPNPDCGAQDQYGDVCEVCGTHYEALHLENVKCAICGGQPSRRTSNHYFFRLSRMAKFLEEWVSADGHLQEETRNWAKQWLRVGLKDWDISRDAPYFGFPVPGSADQFFYVWLDAPIGYLGTTQRFCAESGREFREYWQDPGAKIFHFIGKDITYFHVLFWPAVLAAA